MYADADAADRAKTQISEDGFTVTRGDKATKVSWLALPRFVARGNLLVVVISRDFDLADRIAKAVETIKEG